MTRASQKDFKRRSCVFALVASAALLPVGVAGADDDAGGSNRMDLRRGAVFSMSNDPGTLTQSGPSVNNGGTDTCWFVVFDDGTIGFTTSFFEDGRISSYRVSPDGSLQLLQADADPNVTTGASDLSFNRDSRFLYQLNSLEGTISSFEVGSDGTIQRIDTDQAHSPSAMAAPLGLAAS